MTSYRQAIAVLALVGVFVALYLWLHRIGVVGHLTCGVDGGCGVVQTSRYAEFLGLPVAFYGVVGYTVLLGASLAGLHPRLLDEQSVTLALALFATLGFAFTLYLKYLELFVIHAVCRWCVASAVVMTAIWVIALLALRRSRSDGREQRGEGRTLSP